MPFEGSGTPVVGSSVCVLNVSRRLTASPPCLVFLGLTSTKRGVSTTPKTSAVPTERFLISFSVSAVMPSTELLTALRSPGFVSLRMICVFAWEMMLLSSLATRWLTTARPTPNFLPSAAICLMIEELLTSPKLRSGA